MIVRALFFATLLAGSCAASAMAQDRGSQADQDACTPDVFRLCSAYIPNEDPIVACLKSNARQLSPACHQVFFPATKVPTVASADATPTGDIAPTPKKARHHRRHHHKSMS